MGGARFGSTRSSRAGTCWRPSQAAAREAAPAGCTANIRGSVSIIPQLFKKHKTLPDAEQVSSRAGRNKHSSRGLPAKLLTNFKSCGLVTIGLIGLHVMHKGPAQFGLNVVGQRIELPQVAESRKDSGPVCADLHVLL